MILSEKNSDSCIKSSGSKLEAKVLILLDRLNDATYFQVMSLTKGICQMTPTSRNQNLNVWVKPTLFLKYTHI